MIGTWTPPPGARLLLGVEVSGEHVPAGSKKGMAVRYKDADGRWRVKVTTDRNGNQHAQVTVSDVNSSKLKKRAKVIQTEVLEAARLIGYVMPNSATPLAAICTFYKPRPKAHYGTGANAEKLKDSAPAYPISAPDCTKLWRGFEDALNGVIWHDDSRIVGQPVFEDFVERWEEPLTRFTLYALPATVGERRAVQEGEGGQSSLLPVSAL